MRIGGLKRALVPLPAEQRKILREAYANAQELVPNLDALWAKWPEALIGYGLGKYLGAVPVPLVTIPKSLPPQLIDSAASDLQ